MASFAHAKNRLEKTQQAGCVKRSVPPNCANIKQNAAHAVKELCKAWPQAYNRFILN
jgi:hypothetical protein